MHVTLVGRDLIRINQSIYKKAMPDIVNSKIPWHLGLILLTFSVVSFSIDFSGAMFLPLYSTLYLQSILHLRTYYIS